MSKFRILSFDGGGIRGLLSVAILERISLEQPGWLDQVDLVAGTSTGGIIALAIAKGVSLADIHKLYYENGERIFSDSWLDNVLDVGRLAGAQYNNVKLRNDLKRTLGENTLLRDLKKKALITAFDLDDIDNTRKPRRCWKPKFFHNFSGTDSDGRENVVDVAMYTSAAPTYFPSVDGFIDGGVCANNPSMAALAQTQDQRSNIANRPSIDEVVLMSVGTGTVPQYIRGSRHDWGFGQWARPLVQIMIDGVTGVADYQCRQILREHYHRIAPVISATNPIDIDAWKKRDDLIRIADKYDLTDALSWLRRYWL